MVTQAVEMDVLLIEVQSNLGILVQVVVQLLQILALKYQHLDHRLHLVRLHLIHQLLKRIRHRVRKQMTT